MKKIIFHHPLPLDKNATSASGIRPLKMVDAFERIGYSVELVTGYGKERKEKIKAIKNRIKSGIKYEFIYSESSTQPTLLTEKNHFPKYPLLDFDFFDFCKKKNIKIGLFYRDIYWLFPEYGSDISFLKRNIAQFFYKYDLTKYNDLLDKLYLPSVQMEKYISNLNKIEIDNLPPGHDEYNSTSNIKIEGKINLLYIGGIGSHYQMHKLFHVLKDLTSFNFTLCTRKLEWQNIKKEYILNNNMTIVHKSGKELKEIYQIADIAMLFVKPQEYREFAAPVKLFEYIGKEKPIIASKGTLVGDFVEKNDIGWSIEYNQEELMELLMRLDKNRDEIYNKIEKIKEIKVLHTWEARALQIEKDLTQ